MHDLSATCCVPVASSNTLPVARHPSCTQRLTSPTARQAPRELVLCIGAQVMLTRNANARRGLVNGARGVVERFAGTLNRLPVVRFACVRPSRSAAPTTR